MMEQEWVVYSFNYPFVITMKLCHDFIKDLNDSEVLIVLKLTELWRSCSKRILQTIQLSQ